MGLEQSINVGGGSDTNQRDYLPTERASLVTSWLRDGQQLSTNEIAQRTGISRYSAWKMLHRLARVVPIYRTQQGLWMWMQNN